MFKSIVTNSLSFKFYFIFLVILFGINFRLTISPKMILDRDNNLYSEIENKGILKLSGNEIVLKKNYFESGEKNNQILELPPLEIEEDEDFSNFKKTIKSYKLPVSLIFNFAERSLESVDNFNLFKTYYSFSNTSLYLSFSVFRI